MRNVSSFVVKAQAVGAGLSAIAALSIAVAPKDLEFASFTRLLLANALCVLSFTGIALFVAFCRGFRAVVREKRYARAPQSIKDVNSYIAETDRRTWNFVGAVFAGLCAQVLLLLISKWPQGASLVPLAPWLVAGIFIAGVGLASIPWINRHALIDAAYLRRARRAQCRHIGFRPSLGLTLPWKRKAPVVATGPESFETGGFDWKFDPDLTQSLLVTGGTGSGKTSTVIYSALEGLFSMAEKGSLPFSLLLGDPKGDMAPVLAAFARKYHRESDLIVLSPDNWEQGVRDNTAIVFNPLDSDDSAFEIASGLVATMMVLGVKSRESFFLNLSKHAIAHSITVFRAVSDEPPCLADVYALIAAPIILPKFDDSGRPIPVKDDYYTTLSRQIIARYPDLKMMPSELVAAIAFFENTYREMNPKQRDGVTSSVLELVGELLSEPYASMMSGRSTYSVGEMLDQGKLLYIDCPTWKRERMSIVLITLVRFAYMRAVLGRLNKPRPSAMILDEYGSLATFGEQRSDASFISLSRQSRHANYLAVQNFAGLFRRTENKAEVETLLGNIACKVALRNTHAETNLAMSKMIGNRAEIFVTASGHAEVDGWFRRGRTTFSTSTRSVPIVPLEAFTRLAVPERGNRRRQYSESIVHLASRPSTSVLDLTWPINRVISTKS